MFEYSISLLQYRIDNDKDWIKRHKIHWGRQGKKYNYSQLENRIKELQQAIKILKESEDK